MKIRKNISFVRALLCISFLLISFIAATPLHAQNKSPLFLEQAGYYRIAVGDFEVTALSDGTLPIKLHDLLTNVTTQAIDSLTQKNFQTPIQEVSVNAYLIKAGNKLILIDAGSAELYGPTLGHLTESLKKAGVKPEQIDAVLITHIHTDHTGGLMLNDKMAFPNATIYISKPEVNFWLSDESRKNAPENLGRYFKEAQDKVGPYVKAGKVKAFEYGKELFPGITPLASPGHTPGHTFYALESKGQRMLFVGDVIHAPAVQIPEPSVTIVFDVDSKAAAKQRINLFRQASTEGYWIAAAHISFPGIGHVSAIGNGYRWVPINYSTSGNGQ
jgi:glyoxylase-like metal-dependent hydrolase (beta-lactamase superfamily II)